jgi:hypothetical protein
MAEPKKRGRPKKVQQPDFSMENQQKEQVETNNFQQDDDDDLKSFLRSKQKKETVNIDNSGSSDIDEEALKEIEDFESQEGINDIPNEDFNPLNEALQNRSYTGGIVNNNTIKTERIIEEPNYVGSGGAKLEVDSELINPNNNSNNNNTSNTNNNTSSTFNDIPPDNSNNNNSSSTNTNANTNVDGSDNLKNLSPKEKRESMEKTADVILLTIKNIFPIPFVYVATYSDKKLNNLHSKNEINLDTEIKRDGTTFREYYKEFNAKVEEAFVVTDAEIEALKEPLVDVLMERDVAMTPMQRLLFVAGQFVVPKIMLAGKFMMEKKSDIEEMKNIHKEKMKIEQDILEKLDRDEKIKKRQEEEILRQERLRKEKERLEKEVKANNDKNNKEDVIEDIEDDEDDNDYGDEETNESPTMDEALNLENDDNFVNDIPE